MQDSCEVCCQYCGWLSLHYVGICIYSQNISEGFCTFSFTFYITCSLTVMSVKLWGHCAVLSCSNSPDKLPLWKKQKWMYCNSKSLYYVRNAPVWENTFRLYRFPKLAEDQDVLQEWIKNIIIIIDWLILLEL